MTEPLELLAGPIDPHPVARDRRRAVLALLIACAGWGGSFTWAKVIMVAINQRSGLADSAPVGVLVLISWRFLLAGAVWMLLFPSARSGWTRGSVGRAALLSLPFTLAMIVQQMSLTRISPAVNAFLTSLCVLFVPLIVALTTRRLPSGSLAISITLAVVGIWMLSDPGEAGFGLGEILGVACSILFSVNIVLINTLLKHDTPARMVGGQMLITGFTTLAITLAMEPAARSPVVLLEPFTPAVLPDFALIVIISTLLAFGLMIFFQPRVDPTRAAFIYLTEPVFAAGYAWFFAGDGLSIKQIAGAGLILAANSLVEWLGQRRTQNSLLSTTEAV